MCPTSISVLPDEAFTDLCIQHDIYGYATSETNPHIWKVLQKTQGFRFSIDAVLLAHFIMPNPDKPQRLLDLGTGSGVMIALLFMWGIYGLNRKLILGRVQRDTKKNVLSYRQIFGIIFAMVTPFILSTFIYNFSTSLNQTIYTKVMKYMMHLSEAEIAVNYGVFAGKAVVISNIPIAIASSMSAAMIPSISGSFATGDKAGTHRQIHVAVQTTMLISIPCAFGMLALAQPVTELSVETKPQKVEITVTSSYILSVWNRVRSAPATDPEVSFFELGG